MSDMTDVPEQDPQQITLDHVTEALAAAARIDDRRERLKAIASVLEPLDGRVIIVILASLARVLWGPDA